MQNNITQLHNVNPEQFKSEIVSEIKKYLNEVLSNREDKEELLTRKQAAKLLALSLPTLGKYAKRGIISKAERRIGVRVLYNKVELLECLAKNKKR